MRRPGSPGGHGCRLRSPEQKPGQSGQEGLRRALHPARLKPSGKVARNSCDTSPTSGEQTLRQRN